MSTAIRFHEWSTILQAQESQGVTTCNQAKCCSSSLYVFPYASFDRSQNGKQEKDLCDYSWDCRLDCYRLDCGDNEDGDYNIRSYCCI